MKNYQNLYLKYKNKYIDLKNKMNGGSSKINILTKQFSADNLGQGIIFGHGRQIEGEFCIVPDNIILRPTSRIGSDSTLGYLEEPDDITNLFIKENRKYIVGFKDDFQNYYLPGSLIPNMIIELRSVFPNNLFSFTGIVTGNIKCDKPNKFDCLFQTYIDEETTKRESLKFNDERILSNDNWGTAISLSDLLQLLSKKIKEYESGPDKLPKIYILQSCRSGCHTVSKDVLSRCFGDNIPREYSEMINDSAASFEGMSRTPSVSQVREFIDFKNDYIRIRELIETRNKDFLDKFIPNFVDDFKCKSEINKCRGPLINKCNNTDCEKTCEKIAEFLMTLLIQVTISINNGRISYETFCLFNNLKYHRIPESCTKVYKERLLNC